MKALAASSIGQYENAVVALNDYFRTVEFGLSICLRDADRFVINRQHLHKVKKPSVTAIVFGSDQGLVGQFNVNLAEFTSGTLNTLPAKKKIWLVGDRIQSPIEDAGFRVENTFNVPAAVNAIATLVSQILSEGSVNGFTDEMAELYIFHNRPQPGSVYQPVSQRLLPLDELWLTGMSQIKWPTSNLAEALIGKELTLPGLIREYLFVSLYRACAESLASENAARLAAMQRAEKNISDLKQDLLLLFHRMRQSSIDEELFDLISGSEALGNEDSRI